MKKGFYFVLVILLVVAFGASALYLGNYFLEGKQQENRYNELSNMVNQSRQEAAAAATEASTEATTAAVTEAAAPTVAESLPTSAELSPYANPGDGQYYTPDVIEEPENTPERPVTVNDPVTGYLPWYTELHEQNSDMVGWVQIEGTKINYPVMQTEFENSNYYLYRDFDKKDSVRGSIYARETCDVFKPSDNITLYGHNMKDGSMFAYLGQYFNKETWEKNPLIFFDTLTESHVYKIFAVFKTSANKDVGFSYHTMEDAANEADFNAFIASCKELSFYDTGITPVYGDKLICLSTCEYTLDNGRFVVAAVRIT